MTNKFLYHIIEKTRHEIEVDENFFKIILTNNIHSIMRKCNTMNMNIFMKFSD